MCQDCEYLEKPFKRKDDTSAFEFLEKKKAIQNSNIVAIVASKWMENKVKQSPIWKDKQIYRLPFGINQEIFKPSDKNIIKKELKIPNDAIVLMFRSDDSPYKGSNIIKDALKKLKTNKKIVILTVAQKGNLKEFRDKFDIREYGWLNNDEILAQLYQASDLFLMPSSQEAFGMMAIEAMSCAVPVLSIKNTSLEDVTNAPECGICVEKEEYAFELQRLIDNCSEIKERGKKSLDFARNNYNKDIYIDKLIKIYQYTIDSFDIDNDAKVVLEQLNRYAKTNEMNIKKPYAYNKLWRLLYKLTYRIYLKKKYGKERVKNIFDKKYL
jgi:glycosyltransferase involved in cell wall biosynthesis